MLGFFLFVGLVYLSITYNKPLVLATFYTFFITLIYVSFGNEEVELIVVGALIIFFIMWLFFWLLKITAEKGILWWLVVILFTVPILGLNFAT